MFDWGDEPRRARVAALLVRSSCEAGQLDEAAAILLDCQPVVQRLNLPLTGNDLSPPAVASTSRMGAYDKALSALASACKHYEAGRHDLRLAETLLPLSEAAAAAGNRDLLGQAASRFDELLPLVPGMALPHAASRVRLLCCARPVRRGPRLVATWWRSASAGTATRGSRAWPTRLERQIAAAEAPPEPETRLDRHDLPAPRGPACRIPSAVTPLSGSPAVVAAIIGLFSGLLGASIALFGQFRLSSLQVRREAEAVLAKYSEPLLGAAYELAGPALDILKNDFLERYHEGDATQRAYAVDNTLYVVAQYFGWSEIVRRDLQFLSFSDGANEGREGSAGHRPALPGRRSRSWACPSSSGVASSARSGSR